MAVEAAAAAGDNETKRRQQKTAASNATRLAMTARFLYSYFGKISNNERGKQSSVVKPHLSLAT